MSVDDHVGSPTSSSFGGHFIFLTASSIAIPSAQTSGSSAGTGPTVVVVPPPFGVGVDVVLVHTISSPDYSLFSTHSMTIISSHALISSAAKVGSVLGS